METKRIQVTGLGSDGLPIHREAMLIICSQCGCEQFILYRIVGHTHDHLQCMRCGCSYCYNGACAEEEGLPVPGNDGG